MLKSKPFYFDAVHSLVGGGIKGGNDLSKYEFFDGQTPPSKAEVDAEFSRLQAEYDAQEYARARKPLYPDIGDQLDDLYHKGAFSTEMKAKIKKVKDDNPKPE